MNNFFQRNTTIKVISLLLAVLLWIYVSNVQNPLRERIFNSVPLTQKGLKESLTLVKMPTQITVRVQGNKDQIDSLGIRDLTAYVDLTGVGPGAKSLPVKVALPPGVQLTSVTPSKVSLTIDEWQTKQVPIIVKYLGKLAKNYRTLTPVVTPQKVVVKGPHSLLQNIHQVFVSVDLKNATQDIMETLPVQIGEVSGQAGVEIEPRVAEVLIPVEALPTKKVSIKAMVTGQPAQGYKLGAVVANPSVVTVVGTREELDKINVVQTVQIDVTGKEQSFQQQVNIKLPRDIQLVKDEKPVVTVEIVPVQVAPAKVAGTLVGVSVEVRNAKTENKVTLNPAQVDVAWTGQPDPNLKLWVDVANLPPGVHQLPVQVQHEPSMQVNKLVPEHISVTIE